MNKILNNREHNKISVFDIPNSDGQTTEVGEETLNELLKAHFPTAGPVPHRKYSSAKTASREVINKMYENWINVERITEALEGFDGKKSPGPDELKPLIFKHLDNRIVKYIEFIYKSCIFLHYTPRKWKETKVIFIPKPGKSNYRIPKAVRPISLSNYFLKGLERLVCWKMDEALIKYPIHPKQHGFTANESTESALSNTCLLYTSPSPRDS